MFHLELEREFNVPVERLFDFWTNPAFIQRWFAPGNATVPEVEADLTTGGRYRVVMQGPDGDRFVVTGVYRTIKTNERLAFTWNWDHAPNTSLVELHFSAVSPSRSKLFLRHSEFADEAERDKHGEGWEGCLHNLTRAADTA